MGVYKSGSEKFGFVELVSSNNSVGGPWIDFKRGLILKIVMLESDMIHYHIEVTMA